MNKREEKQIMEQSPTEMLKGKPTPMKNRHLILMLIGELRRLTEKLEEE